MIKALFFDIDGTVVSFRTHRIPESTVRGLTEAKEAGVEIYISTGRPYRIINNICQIEHLIDGYITTNGAYCFIGDRVISCSPIDDADVRTVLGMSDSLGFACMVVGEKDLCMYNIDDNARHVFSDILNVPDYGADTPVEKVLGQRILQLSPFITPEQEAEMMPSLKAIESGRWHPAFTDMTAKGVSKAKGLLDIASYRGFDIRETMAFGDGGNDLSIIKKAGTGVAMGNANEILKLHADYVTTSVDDDGISNALRHFGVI